MQASILKHLPHCCGLQIRDGHELGKQQFMMIHGSFLFMKHKIQSCAQTFCGSCGSGLLGV